MRRFEDLSSSEARILHRLLAGDAPRLTDLKRQWEEPFKLGVSRHHPRTRKPYRTQPNEYQLLLIFNGNRQGEFTIDSELNFELTDFWMIDDRVPLPIQVIGRVHRGILGTLVFRSATAIKWPRRLRMDSYWYVDTSGRRLSERSDVSKFSPPSVRVSVDDLPSGWVSTVLKEAARHAPVSVFPAATTDSVGFLCARFQIPGLPPEYENFLHHTDGGMIRGLPVLGTKDAYQLDSNVYGEEHLVISTDETGRPIVLLPESGEVLLLHDPESPELLAKNFRDWLRSLATEERT